MKSLFFILFTVCFLGFSSNVIARNYTSEQILRHVNETPRDAENNISSLVSFLTKPFDNDYDKAKAIAFWIASRIHYDSYLFNGEITNLISSYSSQKPEELINSRVGICRDFALLFMAMCQKAGIHAPLVFGIAYPTSTFLSEAEKKKLGHVWNYFWYEGMKIYVDTTFMSKNIINVSGTINSKNRRKSINEIKKLNEKKSHIMSFDEYYFDFDYKDEEKEYKCKREEVSFIHPFETTCRILYISTKITLAVLDAIFKTDMSGGINLKTFTAFGKKIDYRITEEIYQIYYSGGFYEYLAKNFATLLKIIIKSIENKFHISILDDKKMSDIVEFGKNLDKEIKLNDL